MKDTPQARYDALHTVQMNFKLNKNTDADILAHLARIGNKQGYVKALIRADMRKEAPS